MSKLRNSEEIAQRLQQYVTGMQSDHEKLLVESETLRNRLKELEALHIKSINNVGTGLEPITDEILTARFRELRDEVCFLDSYDRNPLIFNHT